MLYPALKHEARLEVAGSKFRPKRFYGRGPWVTFDPLDINLLDQIDLDGNRKMVIWPVADIIKHFTVVKHKNFRNKLERLSLECLSRLV
jgi:hypothetical protein